MRSDRASHLPVATADRPSRAAGRFLVPAVLGLTQIAVISYLFYFPTALGEWSNPVAYTKRLVHVAVIAAIAFVIVAWPRRREIFDAWAEAADNRRWYPSVLLNLGIFSALVIATVALSDQVAVSAEPPWFWFGAYCGLLLANAVSLALIAAPAGYWSELPRLAPVETMLAISGAALVQFAGELARESWHSLSTATLSLAAWILSLYEADIFVDMDQQVLAVGSFRVIILPECSGYEGIGLVIGFLAIYLWMFRKELQFPNALLLLPIGVTAIWLLNAVRIAALVSIGAHVSPAIAANGFHSQGGWIVFLLVTVGLMAVSHRSGFVRRQQPGFRSTARAGDRALFAFLLPFIALMATTVLVSAAAPNGHWLYVLKVVAVGGVLYIYRDAYVGLFSKVSPVSILAGLITGLLWIATAPSGATETPLEIWLLALPPWLAAFWLLMRAVGAIVVVPIAEELAFRGYLHRALISRDFAAVAPGQFTWLAFIGSSIAFGLLHQRWLAGILAGAVYAVVMYRTGRLSDPIAAHATSNCAIMAWAVGAHQWYLL